MQRLEEALYLQFHTGDTNICFPCYLISSTQRFSSFCLFAKPLTVHSHLAVPGSLASLPDLPYVHTVIYLVPPPPFFSVERNKRKALPTPSASHKPLPHPSTHSSTPPAPSAHSCSDRFLVLPPRPCGQVSGSLYFLEPQLHKEA